MPTRPQSKLNEPHKNHEKKGFLISSITWNAWFVFYLLICFYFILFPFLFPFRIDHIAWKKEIFNHTSISENCLESLASYIQSHNLIDLYPKPNFILHLWVRIIYLNFHETIKQIKRILQSGWIYASKRKYFFYRNGSIAHTQHTSANEIQYI